MTRGTADPCDWQRGSYSLNASGKVCKGKPAGVKISRLSRNLPQQASEERKAFSSSPFWRIQKSRKPAGQPRLNCGGRKAGRGETRPGPVGRRNRFKAGPPYSETRPEKADRLGKNGRNMFWGDRAQNNFRQPIRNETMPRGQFTFFHPIKCFFIFLFSFLLEAVCKFSMSTFESK